MTKTRPARRPLSSRQRVPVSARADAARLPAAAGAARPLGPARRPRRGDEERRSRSARASPPTPSTDWGKLPAGMNYGFGCAIVVDSKDRVFVTSRSTQPVRRHLRQGRQAAGDVGQGVRRQGRLRAPSRSPPPPTACTGARKATREYLYWTENVAGGKDGPKIGARVYKTDLKGKVLYTLGNVRKGIVHDPEVRLRPTRPTWPSPPTATSTSWTATAASWSTASTRTSSSSRPSAAAARNTASSTPATASGSTRSRRSRRSTSPTAPTTASRSTRWTWSTSGRSRDFRMPCCFYQHDGQLYVPELGARVTILDADDKVVARLGDGKGVKDGHPEAPRQVRRAARPDGGEQRRPVRHRMAAVRPAAEVQAGKI